MTESMSDVCRAGRVDDAVSAWHALKPGDYGYGQELHEWLGWTEAEYARWVETCELPSERKEAA